MLLRYVFACPELQAKLGDELKLQWIKFYGVKALITTSKPTNPKSRWIFRSFKFGEKQRRPPPAASDALIILQCQLLRSGGRRCISYFDRHCPLFWSSLLDLTNILNRTDDIIDSMTTQLAPIYNFSDIYSSFEISHQKLPSTVASRRSWR